MNGGITASISYTLFLTLFVTVLSYSRWTSDPSFVSGNFKPEVDNVFGFFYTRGT